MEEQIANTDRKQAQEAIENPKPSSMWSSIVKSEPAPKPQSLGQSAPIPSSAIVGNCRSTHGISMAAVDANAVIEGGQNMSSFADRFVTVPEVLDEIRDPVSRHRLSFIPFSIEPMEPSPESLEKVIKFARATGDLQTLSDVDLKLIALTYTLEAQIHGTKHLRDAPPRIQTVNVKRLPEKELPGWGSNVPNLEEWEALEHETENKSNFNSRILPLKDLNLNIVASGDHFVDSSVGTMGNAHPENLDDSEQSSRRPRRYAPQKREVKIEGKKMVAEGIDASCGEHDNSADWKPAVSRSTHRRFLRRKARREYYDSLVETESQEDQPMSVDSNTLVNRNDSGQQFDQSSNGHGNEITEANDITVETNGDDLSCILQQMRLEEDSLKAFQEAEAVDETSAETNAVNYHNDNDHQINGEGDDAGVLGEELNNLEVASQKNESVNESNADDVSSEQSWMLRSLSESSVACVTGDFAMQNVILQMGLRLLAPGGMQIRQLHRWVLKCHACHTVTAEIGRIFCPKCGNGGTLRKVAVTVGENGVVLATRRPRIILRGTKFSIPLPQGGRDAITKNPILREDQLPKKFLHPKNKKKGSKQGDDFFSADDIFTHHTDKKALLQPPVRKALAVFSGKRNPNDNHYARFMH